MDEPLKNLAIVLQLASTGGWRYVQRLVEGLKTIRPALAITCYLGQPVLETFASDRPQESLEALGAKVASWPEIPPAPPSQKFRPLRSYRHRRAVDDFQRWLAGLNQHQAIFFAWPYGLECPALERPMFFIPHDFNYLHFIGSWNMTCDASHSQRMSHADWLRKATPIVSSRFIADELTNNFAGDRPHAERSVEVNVIPLARLSRELRLPDDEARQIVRELGIDGDYILSPNNVSHHKNFGQLLGAFYYVLQEHKQFQLVVSGHNTEGITGHLRNPFYLDRILSDSSSYDRPHVVSVGMRSDRQVAALIQCARLVVNASLYEAGNGAGLDAWSLGTPVAMSDIPAFVEHVETLGVEATLFHPRDCFSLRDALLKILNDSHCAAEMALRSQAAMERYDWSCVAARYLSVFERSLAF